MDDLRDRTENPKKKGKKMVYFCPVSKILKNERVRDRVEKDGARKPRFGPR